MDNSNYETKNYIVTFDIWNTILNNISYKKDRIQIMLDYLFLTKKPYKVEEVETAYSQLNHYLATIREKTFYYYVPCLERLDYVLNELLKADFSRKVLIEILSDFQAPVLKAPPPLREGARELIKNAHKNAYLGLVSDTGFTISNTIKQVLRRHGVYSYFVFMNFSENIGFNKPNPYMFNGILEASISKEMLNYSMSLLR